MAKKKEEVIKPKCDYCVHNKGENQQFKFMWLCECLGYCVPFNWVCEAQEKGKGSFELDKKKYNEYVKANDSDKKYTTVGTR